MALNMAPNAGICGHDGGVMWIGIAYEDMSGISYDHPIQGRHTGSEVGCVPTLSRITIGGR